MKKIIVVILSIIIVYLYLHNPIFAFSGGIGSIKLLYPLLILLLFPFTLKYITKQRKVLYSFIAIICYCIFRSLIGGDPGYIYTSIVAMIEVCFLSSIIVALFKQYEIDMFKIVLYVAAVSCVITISALFVPSFNVYIKQIQELSNVYLEENTFRGFGLSEGLTYSYGVILGMIGGISFLYLNKHKWFIVFLPLVALSILVNARTGFIILALCLIVYFLMSKFGIKLKVFFIMMAVALILPSINLAFEDDYTLVFIEQFFLEIGDFFTGDSKAQYSTADVLLKDMIVWPETIDQWVFGRGESIFLGKNSSDNGFILQLNYGGIIYILLLLILMINYFSMVNRENKYLIITLLVALLIANTKGAFIINSGGFRLFALVCCWFATYNKNK